MEIKNKMIVCSGEKMPENKEILSVLQSLLHDMEMGDMIIAVHDMPDWEKRATDRHNETTHLWSDVCGVAKLTGYPTMRAIADRLNAITHAHIHLIMQDMMAKPERKTATEIKLVGLLDSKE